VDADGNARLVRDYVSGKPLSAWMPKADAPARRLVLDAVDAALDAARVHGMVHGHVVPSNIIVAPGGKPVLVDLGAGMVLHALQGVTAPAEEMARKDLADLDLLRAAMLPPH